MYSLQLTENDIKLIRWSMQVSADVLSVQHNDAFSPEEAFAFISQLEELDKSLVKQVKPQREAIFGAPDKPEWEQLSFDI